MQNKLINTAIINWNNKHTPISTQFDDVYFSNEDPLAETRFVFIESNHLSERFIQHQQPQFIIGETGFGSGLNFLLTWQLFNQFREQYPNHPLKRLRFISVENYLLTLNDLQKIHGFYPELASLKQQLQQQWPKPIAGEITLNFINSQLTLWLGDISEYSQFLQQANLKIDCWFFDGFAPAKNQSMWSACLFKQLFQYTQPMATFATFTASGFVRRNLQAAGFKVSKQKGFGRKREMLIGYKG
ncbi:MAG: tRNA (5-methylaminomethyl-2-thiouridine)(34)-methyltransferase MnmD [Candidatus Schmidhempelia sp.]|nr:tRNA (5-methylaminomethyl-2-thiouridine)(34)-methyltransferase MnmD [Candidatus Schmidhempelia sp.]